MRERNRLSIAEPILYERPDWQLLVNRQPLPQKGCEPHEIGRVVLKELVDNALDAGARHVVVTGNAKCCSVDDGGPGLDPDAVPRLFSVNRGLISSKLKRLPTRGMLGMDCGS